MWHLISSFGPFIDTIFSTVEAQDSHIMVEGNPENVAVAARQLSLAQPSEAKPSGAGDVLSDMCEGVREVLVSRVA